MHNFAQCNNQTSTTSPLSRCCLNNDVVAGATASSSLHRLVLERARESGAPYPLGARASSGWLFNLRSNFNSRNGRILLFAAKRIIALDFVCSCGVLWFIFIKIFR
jgi:hypothetical protein